MKNSFWLGDENSAYSFLQSESRHDLTPMKDLRQMSLEAVTELGEDGDFGEFSYMASKVGNLAVVNISGSLTSRNRPYNRYMGVVSYDEIRNAVFAAVDDPEVRGIVLNMDTPGGQASGVSELSDFLSEVNEGIKPIYTYAGTTMASGGYWLGSVGREIYASKLATVGSIGVITVHASYEKQLKDEGIEVTVLRAGEFKALGSPYEKLDDKARSQIESQMNTIYDVFLQTVAENRGTSVKALKETAAEGRVFVGNESVTVGLVDHITSFDAAIASISKKVNSSDNRSPLRILTETNTGTIDMPGKKKVLTEAGLAAIESGVPEAEVYDDPKMAVEATEEESTEGEESTASEAEEGAAEGEGEAETEASNTGAHAANIDSSSSDKMFDKIMSLTEALALTKAELSITKNSLESARSTETSLVAVAVHAIRKMQVSLGGTPMKLADVDAATVLAQYERTQTQFNQRFKVGPSAKVPEGDDFEANASGKDAGNSVLDSAVHRLTTSKINSRK